MANSLYIKNQERICALMMIMTLCLMVYNFAELKLRKLLVKNDDTLPNQLKKEVQNPTLKWVFKLMNCISILYLDGHDHASVLNDTQIKIIRYFGGTALKIYNINTEDF
jgi:transposase